MSETNQILAAIRTLKFEHAVLVTLVKVEGSSFRKPGARMLVTDRGDVLGTVAGGCLETTVLEEATAALRGMPRLLLVDTTSDADVLFGHGLGCPGKLHFLLEPFAAGEAPGVLRTAETVALHRRPLSFRHRFEGGEFHEVIEPPFRLHIFGAGTSSQPLAELATQMGYEVVIVDPRSSCATRDRFPTANGIVIAHPEELPSSLHFDRWSGAVLMTHNVLADSALLGQILGTEAGYIGLVGSQSRVSKILATLGERPLDRVFAPVGLDIGSDSPAEIALAILAEIGMVRSGRGGESLRNRRASATIGRNS